MSRRLPKYNEDSYVHFVTTSTHHKRPLFKDEACCHLLLNNIRFYEKKLGFTTVAWVILPDHFHALIWWDKESNQSLTISTVMHRIKGMTAAQISRLWREEGRTISRFVQVWQDGFYDFNIYSQEKLEEKINYIHMNPVRAGLVEDPGDYRWSSYREFLERE